MTAADDTDLLRRARSLYYSDPAAAAALAGQVLAALDERAAPTARAEALLVHGTALGYTGPLDAAAAALQQGLALADAPKLRAELMRALSIAYGEAGALDTALEWAVQAAEVARTAGDPRLLASTLLSVAVAVSRNGDPATGLGYFAEVLALYEAMDEEAGMAQTLNNMGINAKNLGRFEEALGWLRRAIALSERLGHADTAAIAATNLPEPLRRLGRTEEARAALADAVARASAVGYAAAELHARLQLGEFLLEQGEPAAAGTELEWVLSRIDEGVGGSANLRARAHKALSALHKQAGRFEDALRHHEAYHEAERAQFNEESGRRTRGLQVQFQLARAQQEAQRARLESAELAALSRTDPLTGLPNRRHLDECLAAEITRARRLGHPLALAMIDVDDFKQVNDRLGHGVGDNVLRTVGLLLQRHCRSVDLLARYGGEEFCLLLLEADRGAAQRAAEVLRAAVAAHGWALVDPALSVTLSIGVAALDEVGAEASPAALLAAADARLYAAKRGGKNRVV